MRFLLVSWVATCYDKLAVRYQVTVTIADSLIWHLAACSTRPVPQRSGKHALAVTGSWDLGVRDAHRGGLAMIAVSTPTCDSLDE